MGTRLANSAIKKEWREDFTKGQPDDKYFKMFKMWLPPNHPHPTGYRVLIMPTKGLDKTDGGVYLSDEVQDLQQYGAQCGYVVELGPLAFRGDKFIDAVGKNTPWYSVGDWVVIGKFAGSRLEVDGVEMRIFNDDEILGITPDPTIVRRFAL